MPTVLIVHVVPITPVMPIVLACPITSQEAPYYAYYDMIGGLIIIAHWHTL